MDVLLIRHPEPDIPPGVCYGQLDVPARPGFEAALQAQAALLPKNCVIFSSPLQRCRVPAEILAQQTRSPLTFDPRLMEMSFGEWEGRRWDDLRGPDVARWMADYVSERAPGGESFTEVQSRITRFFKDVLPVVKDQGTVPVVVTHAGVIRALQILWTGMTAQDAFTSSVPYARLLCFRSPELS